MELGIEAADRLAGQGILQQGFPPESGDSLVLEHEGERVAFGVFKTGERYMCQEEREANPRSLTRTAAELTLFQIQRSALYRAIAEDLGIVPEAAELHPGIWELGRRAVPGHGRAKVIFVETGHRSEQLQLCLLQETFKLVCVLGHDSTPSNMDVSSKTVITGMVRVRAERFVSEVFEDLTASVGESKSATFVDLEATPAALFIAGQQFKLPMANRQPADGCRYLAHLFDHTGEPFSCWELYCAIRPELREKAGGQTRTDPAIDPQAKREFQTELSKARADLEEAERDQTMPESEIDRLQHNYERLLEQKAKLINLAGKSRALPGSDSEKARQNVRKALQVVTRAVSEQDADVGFALKIALGKGDPVTFLPPSEWGM